MNIKKIGNECEYEYEFRLKCARLYIKRDVLELGEMYSVEQYLYKLLREPVPTQLLGIT